jgi:YggT family protein
MFVAGNFLSAVATVLNMALTFYMWVLIVRALLSWVNPDPYNPIVQFLYKVTEPVLYPVRRVIGGYRLGIDLSPLVVILVIIFLQQFLVATLREAARQMH